MAILKNTLVNGSFFADLISANEISARSLRLYQPWISCEVLLKLPGTDDPNWNLSTFHKYNINFPANSGTLALTTDLSWDKITGKPENLGADAAANKVSKTGDTMSGSLTFDNTVGIKWNKSAQNNKTPYIGFATDVKDGAFIIGSATGSGWQSGLTIGGVSDELKWKGNEVATKNDLSWNNITGKPENLGADAAANKVSKTGDTMSGNLNFSNNSPITWDSATYRQRIQNVDDSSSGTDIFQFQQSTDSGKTFITKASITDDEAICSKYWQNNSSSRTSTLNFDHVYTKPGAARVRLDLSTGSVSEANGRPNGDGFVQTYFWDNDGAYDCQFYLPDSATRNIQYRTRDAAGTWGSAKWKDIAYKDDIKWSNIIDRPTDIGSSADVANKVNKAGDTMTGTLNFKDVSGIKINSNNKDIKIWEVVGNSGSDASQFGFHELYAGTKSGNDNSLKLYAHNQSGTHVLVREIKQDGSSHFNNSIYIGGELNIKSDHDSCANKNDINFIANDGTLHAYIGSNTGGDLGFYSNRSLFFRPNCINNNLTDGIEFTSTLFKPSKDNTISLGNNGNSWANIHTKKLHWGDGSGIMNGDGTLKIAANHITTADYGIDLNTSAITNVATLFFKKNGSYQPSITADVHTVWIKTDTKKLKISNTVDGNPNTYSFPNKDGTVALTSDIPTVSGNIISGTSMTFGKWTIQTEGSDLTFTYNG